MFAHGVKSPLAEHFCTPDAFQRSGFQKTPA
jgi:hypothetical protein